MTANPAHACDACRRRKIRCDKTQPCSACVLASLSCTFLAPSRPKGRQGKTANVITSLRSTQIQTIQGTISHRPDLGKNSQTGAGGIFRRNEGLLTWETLEACCEFYFAHFHSSVPILEKEVLDLQANRNLMEMENDLYCMVLAFSAFIILQTGVVHSSNSKLSNDDGSSLKADIGYGLCLIHEALEARRSSKSIVTPSVQTVVTSFFFYASYRFLNDQSKAWFFLRESTTLFLSGVWDEDTESDLKRDPGSSQLFWLLLLTERAYAIRKHRPLTLLISPTSPGLTGLSPQLVNSGFMHLVKLYQPFDEIFLGAWNSTSLACSVQSLLSLETHLQQTVSVGMNLSDIQMADLLVSQQWLRMVVWQLSTKLGFLSSTSTHESLTFRYPVDIARDLTISTWSIPQQSMEIHGIGLVEKLFDICYQLMDVIAYTRSTPLEVSAIELGPEDYLSHLFGLISKLRGAEDRFLPLLEAKLGQTLPNLANPLTRPVKTTGFLAISASPDYSSPDYVEDSEMR